MGRFTPLVLDDVRAIFGDYDVGRPMQFEPLEAGTINTNGRVRTDRDRLFFLRINEGKTLAEVSYESRLVAHLAARGLPIPVPTPTRTGAPHAEFQGKFVTLFPWIEGRHLDVHEVQPVHAAEVGKALAHVHLGGLDWTERREGIYTLERIDERFRTFSSSSDPVLAEALPILREELGRLRAVRAVALPEGIIHQDLFRDNVLFDPTGQVVALIDFEQAVWGRWCYDLAVVLLAWCFVGNRFDPTLTNAMITAYDRVRKLWPEERSALDIEARIVAVRFTVTRITDVYLRGTGQSGKDFRSYLERLRALRAGATLLTS